MQIRKRLPAQAGINLLELLIVLAVAGLMLAMVFRFFDNWRPMFQLESATRRAASLISKARLEALRRNVTTVVEVNVADGTFFAYADVNGNSSPASAAFPNYLVFNPIDAVQAARRMDDYEIGQAVLPVGVSFGDPTNGIHGAESVAGMTTRPAHADPGANLLVFDSSGRVLDVGSYRFTRLEDNYLEIGVHSVAGTMEVRKFLQVADRPVNGADDWDGFYARGNEDAAAGAVGKQVWVWY